MSVQANSSLERGGGSSEEEVDACRIPVLFYYFLHALKNLRAILTDYAMLCNMMSLPHCAFHSTTFGIWSGKLSRALVQDQDNIYSTVHRLKLVSLGLQAQRT